MNVGYKEKSQVALRGKKVVLSVGQYRGKGPQKVEQALHLKSSGILHLAEGLHHR